MGKSNSQLTGIMINMIINLIIIIIFRNVARVPPV